MARRQRSGARGWGGQQTAGGACLQSCGMMKSFACSLFKIGGPPLLFARVLFGLAPRAPVAIRKHAILPFRLQRRTPVHAAVPRHGCVLPCLTGEGRTAHGQVGGGHGVSLHRHHFGDQLDFLVLALLLGLLLGLSGFRGQGLGQASISCRIQHLILRHTAPYLAAYSTLSCGIHLSSLPAACRARTCATRQRNAAPKWYHTSGTTQSYPTVLPHKSYHTRLHTQAVIPRVSPAGVSGCGATRGSGSFAPGRAARRARGVGAVGAVDLFGCVFARNVAPLLPHPHRPHLS